MDAFEMKIRDCLTSRPLTIDELYANTQIPRMYLLYYVLKLHACETPTYPVRYYLPD